MYSDRILGKFILKMVINVGPPLCALASESKLRLVQYLNSSRQGPVWCGTVMLAAWELQPGDRRHDSEIGGPTLTWDSQEHWGLILG